MVERSDRTSLPIVEPVDQQVPPSIFNDVIGPVMRGPSSSHCAAALRIGRLARDLMGGELDSVLVEFHPLGSLATTHASQGSDMGLFGGLLGWEATDERLVDSEEALRSAGIEAEIRITEFEALHPNTYRITLKSAVSHHRMVALSTGGGIIRVVEIDGVPLSLDGGRFSTLVFLEGPLPDGLQSLSADQILVHSAGERHILQVDTPAEPTPGELRSVLTECGVAPTGSDEPEVRTLRPVLPVWSRPNVTVPFLNATQLAEYWKTAAPREPGPHPKPGAHPEPGPHPKPAAPPEPAASQEFAAPPEPAPPRELAAARGPTPSLEPAPKSGAEGPLWEWAVAYESARGGLSRNEVVVRMREIIRIMEESVREGLAGTEYRDRILPAQTALFRDTMESGGLLEAGLLNRMILYVSAIMEVKSSMGVIVAAPTAGSCGALPGAVLAAGHALNLDSEAMAKAMLAAGLVGIFIAANSTFAAEECGCQAECGAGSGMAAAALVTLMGGSAGTALGAASMAMQNTMGMVCDPVANRVEVPCLGRNVLAASNALASANLALAGFDPVIPLDEVITTMDRVGRSLPRQLRCTALGGLSVTETSRRIQGELERGS